MKGTVMENCPFCGRQAIVMNPQGVSVCTNHREAYLELKCLCGGWLDILRGKYGVYCNCFKCGNMTLKRALEVNRIEKPDKPINSKPTNTIIRSDEL